jgi:phosphonate transport system permease protein
MAKTPKKSRSVKTDTLPRRLRALRPRLAAFLLDWVSWGYISYGVMFLLNHFWYTEHVSYYGTLTLPIWGWPLVIIGTLEMAAIGHAFGESIGLSLFGLKLLTDDRRFPTFRDRLARYLWWHLSVISFPVTLWKSGWKDRLLHDRQAGTVMFLFADVKDDLPLKKPRSWCLTNRGVMAIILIGLTFWLGWLTTQIDLRILVDRAPKSAYLWHDLVHPDFAHLIAPDPDLKASILDGMLESIFMALLATAFGGLIAFPLSFLGARNIMGFSPLGWLIYAVTRAFFNIFRSIESILWAVIFAVWVGFGPFAGVLALTIHTIAALGKLYSEQVEGIDPGPLEAIAATGASRWQVVMYGVIPQIIPSYLAFSLYRWDINVRMATVIAMVGGGGIGRILFYYKGQVGRLDNAWNQVGAVVFTIVAVVWLLDYVSGRVREKIV